MSRNRWLWIAYGFTVLLVAVSSYVYATTEIADSERRARIHAECVMDGDPYDGVPDTCDDDKELEKVEMLR